MRTKLSKDKKTAYKETLMYQEASNGKLARCQEAMAQAARDTSAAAKQVKCDNQAVIDAAQALEDKE